jgi:hypothetical protein
MCLSNIPDQSRHTFKAVLVELRITRVLADLAEDVDKLCQDALMRRSETLPSGDDHAHST